MSQCAIVREIKGNLLKNGRQEAGLDNLVWTSSWKHCALLHCFHRQTQGYSRVLVKWFSVAFRSHNIAWTKAIIWINHFYSSLKYICEKYTYIYVEIFLWKKAISLPFYSPSHFEGQKSYFYTFTVDFFSINIFNLRSNLLCQTCVRLWSIWDLFNIDCKLASQVALLQWSTTPFIPYIWQVPVCVERYWVKTNGREVPPYEAS